METYNVSGPLWTEGDSWTEDIPIEKKTSSPKKEKKDLKHTNVVGNVCEQCRKSKVKCDRRNPCARCVRLGLPCTRTPPSRRGRKRTKTMQSCEGLVLEAIDRSLKKERKEEKASAANGTAVVDEKVGPQVGVGIQFLVRTWIFNCFRRRSTCLLLKAAKLAMQCNFSLDDIIGEKDGPMSSRPSLMFSKTQSTLKIDDLIGKRLKLEDFDKSLVDLLRKHTGHVGDEKGSFYIFGRRVDKGYMRYYFTPDFERDFKTDEEEPDFCMRQPCWRPIFSTPASHDKIMKAIAESYVVFEAQEFQSFHSLHRGLRSYLSFEINSYKTTKKNRYKKTTKLNTPSTPKILSVQATRRTGDVVDVQVAISVRRLSCNSQNMTRI